jgi:LysM repeat protein
MILNSPKKFAYIIQAGDTFQNLADRYDTNVKTILAINPMVDSDFLKAGQVIAMPGDPPSARGPRFEEKRRAELDRRRRREAERRRRTELGRRRRHRAR